MSLILSKRLEVKNGRDGKDLKGTAPDHRQMNIRGIGPAHCKGAKMGWCFRP